MKNYEAPAIESLGTIAEVTAGFGGPRGDLFNSNADGFFGGSRGS